MHLNPSIGQLLAGVWLVLVGLGTLFHVASGGVWEIIIAVIGMIAGLLLVIGR